MNRDDWKEGDPPIPVPVTPDSRFSSYVRWESGGVREIAASYLEWIEDLEKVGAMIDSAECDDESCEINYTMTLRQAWEIPWDFDFLDGTPTYLAEHLHDPETGQPGYFAGETLAQIARDVAALWDGWGAARQAEIEETIRGQKL